jgi:hypothetical protein
LLSQFSREGEDSSESPSDDVLGAVGQQDELMRDRVIHMIERLGELRSLREDFTILIEPLLALAREHLQVQARLMGRRRAFATSAPSSKPCRARSTT